MYFLLHRKLFRNTEIFKSMDPHYYQCSRRTTSVEIETVFQHAIKRQQSLSMPIRCGKKYLYGFFVIVISQQLHF